MAASYAGGQEVRVNSRKQISWAAAAIVAVTLIAIGAEQLYGQRAPQLVGDFRNAAQAEVRDAQGQVLLTGQFAPIDADDQGEVERLARLAPITAGSTASGEAEVEYQTDDPSTQEIELTATGIAAGAQVSLVIDGANVGSATADAKGKVELEIEARSAVR
jgi:hypothetical protein